MAAVKNEKIAIYRKAFNRFWSNLFHAGTTGKTIKYL